MPDVSAPATRSVAFHGPWPILQVAVTSLVPVTHAGHASRRRGGGWGAHLNSRGFLTKQLKRIGEHVAVMSFWSASWTIAHRAVPAWPRGHPVGPDQALALSLHCLHGLRNELEPPTPGLDAPPRPRLMRSGPRLRASTPSPANLALNVF